MVIIMLSKYCDKCHKRLKIGEKCTCTYKTDHKICSDDDFYNTSDWHKAREQCKMLCCGLDLYSLSQGRIEYGFTVHHIEPINLKPDLRLVQSNLIYLTESNHRIIHGLYDSGQYEKTVILLQNIKERFIRGCIENFLKFSWDNEPRVSFYKFLNISF